MIIWYYKPSLNLHLLIVPIVSAAVHPREAGCIYTSRKVYRHIVLSRNQHALTLNHVEIVLQLRNRFCVPEIIIVSFTGRSHCDSHCEL